MKSTKLACGHLFYWREFPPDDLSWCSSCQKYCMPDELQYRIRSYRLSKEERAKKLASALQLRSEGVSVKDIAAALHLSEPTVRNWLREDKRK